MAKKDVPKRKGQKLEVQPFGVCLNRELIDKKRKALALSIADLASDSKLSVSFIQQVLSEDKGKGLNPSLGAVVALAGTLSLKISEILIEIDMKSHQKYLQFIQDIRTKGKDKSYHRDFAKESRPTWAGKVKV